MKKLYAILPLRIKEILLKIRGVKDRKTKKSLKMKIINSSFDNQYNEVDWKEKLIDLLKYGKRYEQFIDNFLSVEINRIKVSEIEAQDESIPIVLCVVKNDLLRMKLFLQHYRELGIEHFAILDDMSSDGTREYLIEQKDVDLFVSNVSYSTVVRQVWLNKMASVEGIEKWYIVVDSDELLEYVGCEVIKVNEITKALQKKGRKVGEGLLIDMISKGGIFDKSVKTELDIEQVYNLFSKEFCKDYSICAPRMIGGVRMSLFGDNSKALPPVVSKYPLVYFDKDMILLNSHYYFPFEINYNVPIIFGLKHYKFLPGDEKKYAERREKKNFVGNSEQYDIYEKKGDLLVEKAKVLEQYSNSSSLLKIPYIEDVSRYISGDKK